MFNSRISLGLLQRVRLASVAENAKKKYNGLTIVVHITGQEERKEQQRETGSNR